jgi:SNF2 family DNA or RNA helicase
VLFVYAFLTMLVLTLALSSAGSADPCRRPSKRQRTSRSLHQISPAAAALLERVANIRSYALEIRDEHQALIDDYDRRAIAKRAASKASAKIQPRPPCPEVLAFSKGDVISSKSGRRQTKRSAPRSSTRQTGNGFHVGPAVNKAPVPALSLLAEPEPPEKLMVEQSVIWRAHMINRKNAELARERLPKQPEAQRGKTYWDYVLDEALWLANDFREERKWKLHLAKKVSKMVMQYHAQQAQRADRALRGEEQRLLRLAHSVARDVRKFWNQIHELADYRASVLRDARMASEREEQLRCLLKQTEAYTSVLAQNMQSEYQPNTLISNHSESEGLVSPAIVFSTERDSPSEPGGRVPRKRSRQQFESDPGRAGGPGSTNETSYVKGNMSDEDSSTDNARDASVDDERTMAEAEAGEGPDPLEIDCLRDDADLTVEELLRRQGIDPDTYAQDSRNYIGSNSDSDDGSSSDLEAMHIDQTDDSIHEVVLDRQSSGLDAAACSGNMVNHGALTKFAADMSAENLGTGSGSIAFPPRGSTAKYVNEGNAHSSGQVLSNDVGEDIAVAVAEYLSRGEPGNGADDEGAVSGVPRIRHPGTSAVESVKGSSEFRHQALPCVLGTQQEKNSDVSSKKWKQPDTEPGEVPGTACEMQVDVSPNKLRAPFPLLRGSLRDYQQAGVEWLVTMYNQNLNGILADEMGLGKTIQTIALLAWLAQERGIWGPHLVVVPTSVLINWEVEFKKWLPGFKILTYYGSLKERRAKRRGWSKPNTFHVCITSYSLVVQDASALRRKKWVYLILDEAHNIKNFRSQRWQTLLNFPSRRRLLLTGTPLQNSVMELWSLMHFLMPDVFRSHAEFKDWFSKPLNAIVGTEGKGDEDAFQSVVVTKLHKVLRPFLLRRLKADVEKGLPGKTEHILTCPLSKRQRQLYEDFLSRSDIKETLSSGDFIGVMNVLMQLRKVCNHPDLFEGRPIISPLLSLRIFYPVPSLAVRVIDENTLGCVDLTLLGLDLASAEAQSWPGNWARSRVLALSATQNIIHAFDSVADIDSTLDYCETYKRPIDSAALEARRRAAFDRRSTLRRNMLLSELRTRQRGMIGADVISAVTMTTSSVIGAILAHRAGRWDACPQAYHSMVRSLDDYAARASIVSDKFTYCFRRVLAQVVEMRYAGDEEHHRTDMATAKSLSSASAPLRQMFRSYDLRSVVSLPDARLIQWDCGKLQVLDKLMRGLKRDGHRVLVFTQMTRVLDVLETFLNLHAYRYLRLDGSTRTDERQRLVERFNADPRVFCMILTTRAGGLGLNLTGADTVVFYDTDYNPSMDAQAQDRAHRIGQTKAVHIYRLVSERTVEENILKRAQQKRTLESLVISRAGFTTDAFRKDLDVMGLVQRLTPEDRAVPPSQLVELPELHSGQAVPFLSTNSKALSQTKAKQTTLSRTSSGDSVSPSAFPNPIDRRSIPEELLACGRLRDISSNNDVSNVENPDPPDPDASVSDCALRSGDVLDYGEADISATLLAAEDETEVMAHATRKCEARLAHAEFDEEAPVLLKKIDIDDDENMDVLGRLTPVQRYALQLVEGSSGSSDMTSDGMVHYNGMHSMPHDAHKDGQRRSVDPIDYSDIDDVRRLNNVLHVSGVVGSEQIVFDNDEDEIRNPENQDSANNDDLVYDIDLSDSGQADYLKALTDIDADIKVYLPLRDDDPEELKLSNVVNGTAAAGLECAEDAAFFPHAYNRMSRTPYATKRQKEKAAANVAKRLADEKRNKGKEKCEIDVGKVRHALVPDSVGVQAPDKSKPTIKAKPTHPNASKGIGGVLQPAKRPRLDAPLKQRYPTAIPSFLNRGPVASPPIDSASGLFTKSVKKLKNRQNISFATKNGAGQSLVMSKEDIGANEGWTVGEEQRLLDLVVLYNKNMSLVADALSLDPRVAAGQRMARGQIRCVDRMKTLTKDVKNGPPVCRATVRDMDVMRRHSKALLAASHALRTGTPSWLRSSISSLNDAHPSHVKIINEVSGRRSGRFPDGPPTLASVTGLVSAPEYHRPGLKPAECTPAYIAKLKRPFIRPRVLGDRARPLSSGPQRSSTTSPGASVSSTASGINLNSFHGIATGYPNGITPGNVPVCTPFNAAQFGQTQKAVPAFESPSASGMHRHSSDEQHVAPPRGVPITKKRSVASLGPPNRAKISGTEGQGTAHPVGPTTAPEHPLLTHHGAKGTRPSTALMTSKRFTDIRTATVTTSNSAGYTEQPSNASNGDRNPTNTSIPGALATGQGTKELERTPDNPEEIGGQHT